MDDVINGMWMSDESLCIELSREVLNSGTAIQITVDKVFGAFRISQSALPVESEDKKVSNAYLNRMCAKYECDDCPAYDLCKEDLEQW